MTTPATIKRVRFWFASESRKPVLEFPFHLLEDTGLTDIEREGYLYNRNARQFDVKLDGSRKWQQVILGPIQAEGSDGELLVIESLGDVAWWIADHGLQIIWERKKTDPFPVWHALYEATIVTPEEHEAHTAALLAASSAALANIPF